VQAPLAGMDYWITRAVKHSNKSLWNNGSWIIRDIKNKPGTISNHAKGVAVDLSYRLVANEVGKSIYMGRQRSLPYIIKLLENADTLGIELVIDYALMRSWKCDRGTWIKGNFQTGDWYHIEVNSVMCHSPELAKQAWNKVFGVIPTVTNRPV
jgi:hypothetical protein